MLKMVMKAEIAQAELSLKQLGIEHIGAYSPEARGRSERAFDTHQGRLPKELAKLKGELADMGLGDIETAADVRKAIEVASLVDVVEEMRNKDRVLEALEILQDRIEQLERRVMWLEQRLDS